MTSTSIGKSRMTTVSVVKTMESYEVCRWIILGLQIWSPSGKYIYWNGPKRAGLITASDQTCGREKLQ